jgi:Transposase DDE domain
MAPVLLADLAQGGGPWASAAQAVPTEQTPVVDGDAADGTGALLTQLDQPGMTAMATVAAPTAPAGHFHKAQFGIDLEAGRVTCPAGLSVPIIPARGGGGVAGFGRAGAVCPLASACTSSRAGRTITSHPHQGRLQAARARQRDPAWRADDRAHRPTVEGKLAHLLRRRHGGRRARVRGRVRVAQDFRLLAAAVNPARFAALGVRSRPGGWALAAA